MNQFLKVTMYITLLLSIIIPVVYLIIINKKRRKIMIGHYFVAIITFLSLIFVGFILKSNISTDDSKVEKPVEAPVEKPPKEDDNMKDNPNYIETTPKGYIVEKKNGAYYVDGYLLVNKSYALDSDFVPKDTYYDIGNEDLCIRCIDKEGYTKWLEMKNDAAAISLNIFIASGYRSYSYQEGLYNRYIEKDGKQLADTYSARPGNSEHQSGLSFDLNSVDSSFEATNEGKWVNDNAYLYGFIIRFPKGKTNETGYKYEPWHLRYVGKDLAKKLYNNGDWISMESYFGLDSKY